MTLFYYIYNNCKSNRDTVIVVKRFFSLTKTIVVDVIVIYIPRIPVVFSVMGGKLLWGGDISVDLSPTRESVR